VSAGEDAETHHLRGIVIHLINLPSHCRARTQQAADSKRQQDTQQRSIVTGLDGHEEQQQNWSK
jgi:hypothetical protein